MSLLSEHGVALPDDLFTLLHESVLFPGEKNPVLELVEQNPSPSILGKFSPPDKTVKLQLSKKVSIKVLSSLATTINNFVDPVAQYIEILVYFNLHPSKVFCSYLQNEMDVQLCTQEHTLEGEHPRLPVTVSILRNALQHTVELMAKIVQGTATYGEIVAVDALYFKGGTGSLSQRHFPLNFSSCNCMRFLDLSKMT